MEKLSYEALLAQAKAQFDEYSLLVDKLTELLSKFSKTTKKKLPSYYCRVLVGKETQVAWKLMSDPDGASPDNICILENGKLVHVTHKLFTPGCYWGVCGYVEVHKNNPNEITTGGNYYHDGYDYYIGGLKSLQLPILNEICTSLSKIVPKTSN